MERCRTLLLALTVACGLAPCLQPLLAHELAGHRGPTYQVTDPVSIEPEGKWLNLNVLDDVSGKPTSARFSLTVDGQGYTPEGLAPGGLRFVSIHAGKKQEFVALYSRGRGEVGVPLPRDARSGVVHLAKGLEYLQETVPFEVSDGSTQITIRLRKWSDVGSRGWVSTEEHLHYDRLDPARDQDWLTMLGADDLAGGHFLVVKGGNLPGIWATQYAYGQKGATTDGRRSITPGEEYRDALQGHINLLGVSEVIPPIITGSRDDPYHYPAFLDVLNRARDLGGVVGPAHGTALGRSPTGIADTVLGAVDFFEIANTHLYNTEVWYRLMNCGYVVPPVAGTDLPNYPFRDAWQPLLGEVRTYVRTDGAIDYESFKAAIRRGETFISCGPMIRLAVNGAGPGGTIRASLGEEVLVEAELSGPRPPKSFDILLSGTPLGAEVKKEKDGRVHRWRVTRRVKITRSCWLAARGEGGRKRALQEQTGIRQNTVAHTGVVRVLAGDRPITSAEDSAFLMDRLTNQMEFYRLRGKYREPEHQARALAIFQAAIDRLKARREDGG